MNELDSDVAVEVYKAVRDEIEQRYGIQQDDKMLEYNVMFAEELERLALEFVIERRDSIFDDLW